MNSILPLYCGVHTLPKRKIFFLGAYMIHESETAMCVLWVRRTGFCYYTIQIISIYYVILAEREELPSISFFRMLR